MTGLGSQIQCSQSGPDECFFYSDVQVEVGKFLKFQEAIMIGSY